MTNSNDKLRADLKKIGLYKFVDGVNDEVFEMPDMVVDAILALFTHHLLEYRDRLEKEVIGEDEHKMTDQDLDDENAILFPFEIRNRLRAEQRKKLQRSQP